MNKSIAVAGTGYVGLSISVLLAQHNHVVAVDIIPEKIALINQKKSPIQDEYIEKYLSEKELDLTATSDGESAYAEADFVVVATPTKPGHKGESCCHNCDQIYDSCRLHRIYPKEASQ